MALLVCHECAKPVSDQAAACPHCGAPVKKPPVAAGDAAAASTTISTPFGIALILVATIVVVLLAMRDNLKSRAKAREADSKPVACAKGDLQCLGNQGISAASVYCPREVEKLAKHSVKWTDGTFESKFSRFRWRDPIRGEITYIGDKAEFQNGFGAFTPVIYECDMAADGQKILDVRVQEGRIP